MSSPGLASRLTVSCIDDSQQADYHQQWNNSEPTEHEASFAHELIAGAASYEAAKAYEQHEEREGKRNNSVHPDTEEVNANLLVT
jgi:hypothetical protein